MAADPNYQPVIRLTEKWHKMTGLQKEAELRAEEKERVTRVAWGMGGGMWGPVDDSPPGTPPPQQYALALSLLHEAYTRAGIAQFVTRSHKDAKTDNGINAHKSPTSSPPKEAAEPAGLAAFGL